MSAKPFIAFAISEPAVSVLAPLDKLIDVELPPLVTVAEVKLPVDLHLEL